MRSSGALGRCMDRYIRINSVRTAATYANTNLSTGT